MGAKFNMLGQFSVFLYQNIFDFLLFNEIYIDLLFCFKSQV